MYTEWPPAPKGARFQNRAKDDEPRNLCQGKLLTQNITSEKQNRQFLQLGGTLMSIIVLKLKPLQAAINTDFHK